MLALTCSVNEITSLADFAFCLNLEELYIRKNNIEHLSEICHLCQLPKLRNLWLADNPCATGDLYRLTVLRTLPNLQKLDNVGKAANFCLRQIKNCRFSLAMMSLCIALIMTHFLRHDVL